MSQTGLTGRLPDQVPPSSPLRVLFGINRMGAANTTSPRGFEGAARRGVGCVLCRT